MKEVKVEGHKLWHHLDRVKQWYETGDTVPIYVEIGLTNICNHNCIFCGLDYARGKNTLKSDVLLKNLEDMANLGIRSICYSGAGEPTLHKDFSLLMQKTKEFGIDVAFSTNVAPFNREKAEQTLPYTSWIRFSISGASPQTHAKIHRPGNKISEKDFPIIEKNLADAVKVKRENNYETTLGVQFLLLEENANEVFQMAEMCKEIGVDNLQVKPYSQSPYSLKNLSVDYSKFSDFEAKLKSMQTKSFKIFYRTSRMKTESKGKPFFVVVNEKGNIQPCVHYYDKPKIAYGNIYQNSFSQIWNSNQRKQIIAQIRNAGISGCKNGCRLDAINKDLYKIKTGELKIKDIKPMGAPAHVNFV